MYRNNKKVLKGSTFVTCGAASYGVLATLVKLAYNEGYTTTEIILSQYLPGLAIMGLLMSRTGAGKDQKQLSGEKHALQKLLIGGAAYGLTGYFYYLSVLYIPVSVGVILLMQAIWMGIVVESLIVGRRPSTEKIWAVVVILVGTVLATDAVENFSSLNMKGIFWGFAAAIMYTLALVVSGRIGTAMTAQRKSFWILAGASLTLVTLVLFNFPDSFNFSIVWKWGLILALFGAVLPPLLFNAGFPKTGIGLGSILISIEIPVSVGMAYFLLSEKVLFSQWIGIGLIIVSIVLINFKTVKREFKKQTAGHAPVKLID